EPRGDAELGQRIEVEPRVLGRRRRRVVIAAEAEADRAVRHAHVVGAADAQAEGVVIAVHDGRRDIGEDAQVGDVDLRSVALRADRATPSPARRWSRGGWSRRTAGTRGWGTAPWPRR